MISKERNVCIASTERRDRNKVIRATEHTVTNDIDSLPNVASIDRMTLVSGADKDIHQADSKTDDVQFKQQNEQLTGGDGPLS